MSTESRLAMLGLTHLRNGPWKLQAILEKAVREREREEDQYRARRRARFIEKAIADPDNPRHRDDIEIYVTAMRMLSERENGDGQTNTIDCKNCGAKLYAEIRESCPVCRNAPDYRSIIQKVATKVFFVVAAPMIGFIYGLFLVDGLLEMWLEESERKKHASTK